MAKKKDTLTPPESPSNKRHEIKGQVLFPDGSPASAVGVTAFNRQLRHEQELGQSRTDSHGRYHIIYPDQTNGTALVVKAFARGGAVLAASQPLFDTSSPTEIDLTIPTEVQAPPPLFERIESIVAALLDGLKVQDLNDEQVSFLSAQTSLEHTVLARFVLAYRLSQDRLPPQFWFALLDGFVIKDPDSLAALDATVVRKSLTRAFSKNEIAKTLKDKTAEWIEAFSKFAARQSVTAPTFLKSALEHAGIKDARKQEDFARLFNEHKALTPELLAALQNNKSFKQEEVAEVLTSFRLAELTQTDFSVVKAIKEEFGVRSPESLRSLARKSEREWISLVQTKHAAGEIKFPFEFGQADGLERPSEVEALGKTLERQFREAFPTTAFAGALDRSLRDGGARGLKQAKVLRSFLERHEDFDLLHTPIDGFLDHNLKRDFEKLAKDENFRQELKAVQRVFKLAPTFAATDALLADGLQSAQQIYRLGETQFVQRYTERTGLDAASARVAWNKAAGTYAAVLTIVADFKALDPNSLPAALQTANRAAPVAKALQSGSQPLSSFPNWENLFQTGDLCDCESCRSVLGPAAYFADLLMYLKDRKAADNVSTVKDVLFSRRPDLGYVELNCQNALTPLPYIDVVNEVLEAAVAANETSLNLNNIPDATTATKAAVSSALQMAGLDFGAEFSLSQVDPLDFDRWVVHGDQRSYLLEKKTATNFWAEVLPNTKVKADQLRACPQYVNSNAYLELRKARHPLSLPFDLFGEEVRAAMQKTGLQRWDFMTTFRSTAAPHNPSDGDVAAEYFGISVNPTAAFDEKRLIVLSDPTFSGQQTVWGASGPNWLDVTGNDPASLSIVKNFLQKTSLEYNELLELLDLKFINQTGDIAVHHLDPSCDTAKKVLGVLDETKLDRIHRFLRLWRKLNGWKLWELDLVIRHPRIGNNSLDEAFLIKLFYFARLKDRLGKRTTIEQICALFGNLNTETRFTKLHEPREDALYQQLFLNRRLIIPLDPAFELNPGTGDLPPGQTISAHRPVIIAALGVRESELIIFEQSKTFSTGSAYLTPPDLNLANLSFLWRHSWLAKVLKFKADEWQLVLKLWQQDVSSFADPRAAWDFVAQVDQIKLSGFTPDELNWILAADRSAKVAMKETDAARFLSALRNVLQKIQAENNPAQFGFLTVATPIDEGQLSALLTTLLQRLNGEEGEISLFLSTLRGSVHLEAKVQNLPSTFGFPKIIVVGNHIPIKYDHQNLTLHFSGVMTNAQRIMLRTHSSLALVTGIQDYLSAIDDLYQQSLAAATSYAFTESTTPLPGGLTLPLNRPSLPVTQNPTTNAPGFIGVMTAAERSDLIAANPTAQAIVEELFHVPRLAIKFFEPAFSASLDKLPPSVDFESQLPAELAAKISYDVEERLLRFDGIMNPTDHAALDAVAPATEIDYHNAVDSLFLQAQTITLPDERIWLTDNDLDTSVAANDTWAKRLANATTKALNYLSRKLTVEAVVQQASARLKLTEAMTRLLLTQYAIVAIPSLPNKSLLEYLTNDFVATSTAVDYTQFSDVFNGWFWAARVAALWKKWKITLEDWQQLTVINAGSLLLDIMTLPVDTGLASSLPMASTDRLLRTSRLLRLRDTLPEKGTTMLAELEKLSASIPASITLLANSSFPADVEQLNDAWSAAHVKTLVESLDITTPSDYLVAETWERLQRAFYYLEMLNSEPNTVQTFANPAMSAVHVATLRELLRSKFGSETWLTLSGEIQDVLRESKRRALVAYLLTRPPADSPTGKWENTNDLYAYYLLDTEMSSCQLTSRLVLGTNSVQLFVQRCFMGLEPEVEVKAGGASGDSAWHWWKWMQKYRVWEANRKVFLFPENWIEPELKPDQSELFRELQNELLQNEINQPNVETAFAKYLEKLDGIAQLEIAGIYQEDDGDNSIVHVFGRTKGAEPHVYYYRSFDYHQWGPWEKVEVDITGDYLIPAVIERRLFLFWPVFTELPDEEENKKNVPIPQSGGGSAPVKETQKLLKLQMAVTERCQKKWKPKRISNDFALSDSYAGEITRSNYQFWPIDRSKIDNRFVIKFEGHSVDKHGAKKANLLGAFEIAGCRGVPELASLPGLFTPAIRPEKESSGEDPQFQKWLELGPPPVRGDKENDFSLKTYHWSSSALTPVLMETPWIFHMTPSWQLSYFDKLLLDGLIAQGLENNHEFLTPLGSWLPFFYNDKKRTFFVLPSPSGFQLGTPEKNIRSYYPEVKNMVRGWEDYYAGQLQEWLLRFDPATLSREQRAQLDQQLQQQLQEERNPPYSDEQFKALLKRYYIRFFHWHLGTKAMQLFRSCQFHFRNFYHPFVCDFAKKVHNPIEGIPALMSRETQMQDSGFSFRQSYVPTQWVVNPPTEKYYPKEIVDFSPDGAYSSYNWELFFHAPLLIANALSKNQHFKEARDWLHFIFNPIGVESSMPGGSAMSKYWITRPLFETTDPQYVQQRIDSILTMLAGNANPDLENQVLDWRYHPFEPHRIANYRTVAYQKNVFMKYLDNLISWGDFLFSQDSMESINEATQLYILAAELLGPPPPKIPPQAKPAVKSFNEMETRWDEFSNAVFEVENLVPPLLGTSTSANSPPLPTLYFCIPHNEKMLGYWNTIADRLHKIRHCMNIDGVVRHLALFEPPIDPGLMVKAAAAGVDISSALSDLNAPLPVYRLSVFLQKANEFCSDVKALGNALLTALEKKDAEALALLRQEHEMKLLDAVEAVREQQINEAKENLEGVKRSRSTVEIRRNYYRDIERLSTQERLHLDKLSESHTKQEIAQGVKLGGSIIALLPGMHLGASGFGGSPHAKISLGGLELGQAASIAGDVISFIAQIAANDSIMASSKASFDRRADDWELQKRLAESELLQLDKQITAAELRVATAENELKNHRLQIENARVIDEFMHSKYTDVELYQWQVGQISSVYFQSYRLAYELAKRAERCFRFELGLQDSSYINFGYWDSLKKGLLAGERLQRDLRELEAAYLEKNRREFELTKNVSLALLDPLALIKLRETGRCFVQFPEVVFDLDYPGHYFRRLKSVSLSMPSVIGPYTTPSCTLRLLNNKIRINTDIQNGYAHNSDGDLPADDSRFIRNNIPVKAIATSSGQNDSGVFELNFHDERYLPFEGAGVISEWSLELFTDLPSNNPDPAKPDFGRPLRQFDYGTISDVIFHIKYTAREVGGQFKNSAITDLRTYFTEQLVPSLRLLDLKQEFPSQWHRFVTPVSSGGPNVFEFEMSPNLFALKDSDKTLNITTIWFLARCINDQPYEIVLTLPTESHTFTLAKLNQYGDLHFGRHDGLGIKVEPDSPLLWQLQMTRPSFGNLQIEEVKDLIMVLGYQWE